MKELGERVTYEPDVWKERLAGIIGTPRFEWAIIGLIVINAIILGLETDKEIYASYGPLLEVLDGIILAIFVAELGARFFVHGTAMLKDPWSVFDIFVVGVAPCCGRCVYCGCCGWFLRCRQCAGWSPAC